MVKKVAAFDLSEAKAGVIGLAVMRLVNEPQVIAYVSRNIAVNPEMNSEELELCLLDCMEILLDDNAKHIGSSMVGLAIPGISVFTRRRSLPPVPEDKVAQIAAYEIQQQIPFALHEICLDYSVIERTDGGGYELLLAAVKAENAFPHINEIISKRRFECVDASAFALYNRMAYDGIEPGHIAFLRLNEDTFDIIITSDGKLNFTRSLPIGKKHLMEKPEENLQILTRELSRTLQYYRASPGGKYVQKMYVLGNIVNTGLVGLQLDVPGSSGIIIEEYKLKRLIEMPGMTETPEMAVVMGLGLRLCGLSLLNINLKSKK
ncbi:MAG: hypothetical protein WCT26_03135 [Candidatus Buchananbacteria bacterium]